MLTICLFCVVNVANAASPNGNEDSLTNSNDANSNEVNAKTAEVVGANAIAIKSNPIVENADMSIPKRTDRSNGSKSPDPSDGKSQLMDIGVKLGIVVGVFLIFMLLMSKKADKSAIPKEAIEVLGRIPFSGRQSLQLVRFGQKLVLVESSANGLKPISEITDPFEVQQMLDVIGAKQNK